ncbi:MAG: UDPGP type 1 family protein [Planctomycetota bacterium]|jgi:UDP-N-acetylglucosamine/UDP-N-acetylgalactosamine diphosphorylase|nr:UDPGP type 1 family protein [Planctomycetota bacterium]
MSEYESILARFRQHGQEHILAGYDALPADQKEQLLADCAKVDFDWLEARRAEAGETHAGAVHAADIEPAPVTRLPRGDEDRKRFARARAAGEEKLRQGKVSAFLVAGGQGTRLGFDGPKGAFPVGPISRRSLFQWHAEQILARSGRYGAAIPFYIMTSRDNDRDTRAFWSDHGHFGLPPEDVFFFRQEMAPCLDFNGKLLRASPSTLAMNPDGHGGALTGLYRSGALSDMKRRGIEMMSYFQVDNPLVTICDPVFIGWHALENAEMSSKVLEKNSPSERIGVVCLRNGKPAVVEYIDLDEDAQNARGVDGRLKFWAGSIAIHMINVGFVERLAGGAGLPWHLSRKKVPYFDGERLIRPSEENACKFETFVFDALPFAERTLNLEVRREHEFAPVKNAEGVDSVATSRRLLSNYFCEWLAECGIAVPAPDASEMPPGSDARGPVVEISPLYSLDAEELRGKIKADGFALERFLLLG